MVGMACSLLIIFANALNTVMALLYLNHRDIILYFEKVHKPGNFGNCTKLNFKILFEVLKI